MFDPSAPHIIILLAVVLLLFGSTRLPGAARALGQSMHIFKKSVKGLDDGGEPANDATITQVTAVQQPAPPPLPGRAEAATQQDVQDLQRQLAELKELQRQAAEGNRTSSEATPSEAQRNQQPY